MQSWKSYRFGPTLTDSVGFVDRFLTARAYKWARYYNLDRRENGGRYKDRTCDPFHVKEVLYR
ncbi:hypothetical protein MTBLM1_70104 [Rhodospirillaceae bacterium LM-1]|nr:hypothetical protein MTBLM1_70104 [Rhodospirillaceae bacterium LM-1]